jgi:hypothetical protein
MLLVARETLMWPKGLIHPKYPQRSPRQSATDQAPFLTCTLGLWSWRAACGSCRALLDCRTLFIVCRTANQLPTSTMTKQRSRQQTRQLLRLHTQEMWPLLVEGLKRIALQH